MFGPRAQRLAAYGKPAFFNIVNYEQVLSDADDVNAILQPHTVVLDEAQRIKNWHTKTARRVKQLRSLYAFVLTGTPLENRIDELYSIVQYLDPELLGPLFSSMSAADPSTTRTLPNCASALPRSCYDAGRRMSKPSCPVAPSAISSCPWPMSSGRVTQTTS